MSWACSSVFASSCGRRRYLEEHVLEVTTVEDLTQAREYAWVCRQDRTRALPRRILARRDLP